MGSILGRRGWNITRVFTSRTSVEPSRDKGFRSNVIFLADCHGEFRSPFQITFRE